MKNTINKNKKIINWKMNLLKLNEGLIIYLEKMIKKWKVFMTNFINKNVSFEKIFLNLKNINNKLQKILILNKIPQNQHLEKNILLIKNFLRKIFIFKYK